MIEAFVTLNDRDLLYRKKDLINWSPALRSTISDIEVEHLYINKRTQLEVPGYNKKITFGEIAYIAYPVEDSSKIFYPIPFDYLCLLDRYRSNILYRR